MLGRDAAGDYAELADKVSRFVRERVIPYESDPRWEAHGPTDELRSELNAHARAAGVFAPHVSKEFGGLGLSHVGRAWVFAAAGYSMLGPIALNCAAPDEGNMHMLDKVANSEQREKFLRPLANGQTRSCFCMTEPGSGAGSDPSQLQTTARRDGDSYVINGTKWLITGASGAAFAIIMANVIDGDREGGTTMFVTPMSRPGIHIERLLDTLDSSFVGGHAVVRFENLRLSEDDILGSVGAGYRLAQIRLAPARLTHCMRWLGAAMRAHDIAADYARRRTAFGKTLGEHQGVSFMLADNAMDIHVAQLVTINAAMCLDRGDKGKTETSMAKVICSEAVGRVVDRSLQVLGGLGITRDTAIERIYRDVRAFRIYDGPSEVHRWALGRRIIDTVVHQ